MVLERFFKPRLEFLEVPVPKLFDMKLLFEIGRLLIMKSEELAIDFNFLWDITGSRFNTGWGSASSDYSEMISSPAVLMY